MNRLTNTARWLLSASICAFFALVLVMTVAELYGPAVALLSAGVVILVAAAGGKLIWWQAQSPRRRPSPDSGLEASTSLSMASGSASLLHLQRATSGVGEEDTSARSEREIAFITVADRGRTMRMGHPQLWALSELADEEETTLACLILRGSTVTADRERFLL